MFETKSCYCLRADLSCTRKNEENKGNRRRVHAGMQLPGGGGDSSYEDGTDARRKFWIKPLKETDLGVAQAFFDP